MPSKKPKNEIPVDKLELYNTLIASHPKIERKGDTVPYTSFNGNMFSLLYKTGTMALRLPPEEREIFLKKYKSKLFEAYGAVMKEYVTVPDSLLKKTKELKKYLDISYAYVQTVKAKPTAKKKPKNK